MSLPMDRLMIGFSNVKKRENLAKAIYDLGKLVFAALALGPIVGPGVLNIAIVAAGVIFAIVLFVLAYFIDAGG